MDILTQYKNIDQEIKNSPVNISVNLIVVTKGKSLSEIEKIINVGHFHFGENRVQESINKWKPLLDVNNDLKIHLIGKLQTNKVVEAIHHFSFIHSLDSEKLALKVSKEQQNFNKKLYLLIIIEFINNYMGERIDALHIFTNNSGDYNKLHDGEPIGESIISDLRQYFILLFNKFKLFRLLL